MDRILITGRNSNFPAVNHSFSPRLASLRGNLAPSVSAMLSEGAPPTYDATAGRWIVPPSGKKPDAGPAAELRDPRLQNTQTVPTPMTNGPVSSPEDTGHSLQAGMEAFTVLAGLAVFGAIAWFFLVLT